MTVESSYQLGDSEEGQRFVYQQSEKTVVSYCLAGRESQDDQFPQGVTKVFEEATNTEREETNTERVESKLSLLLAWLLQTWLVNILFSPLLLYIRVINGLLFLFSLSSLDDCLRKSLESFIHFFLGFGQAEKFPLAAR